MIIVIYKQGKEIARYDVKEIGIVKEDIAVMVTEVEDGIEITQKDKGIKLK